jgi:hypothetical protein
MSMHAVSGGFTTPFESSFVIGIPRRSWQLLTPHETRALRMRRPNTEQYLSFSSRSYTFVALAQSGHFVAASAKNKRPYPAFSHRTPLTRMDGDRIGRPR